MKWYYYVGIGLLAAGIALTNYFNLEVGLGVFAGGVVLTTIGVREKPKEVTAKA